MMHALTDMFRDRTWDWIQMAFLCQILESTFALFHGIRRVLKWRMSLDFLFIVSVLPEWVSSRVSYLSEDRVESTHPAAVVIANDGHCVLWIKSDLTRGLVYAFERR